LRKISTVDAERLIQTTDEEREEFHKNFFNEDINTPPTSTLASTLHR